MVFARAQGTVHLVPVRHEVEDYVAVEQPAVWWVEVTADCQQDGIRRPIADHVQHSPEGWALVEVPSRHPIEHVQQLTHSVEHDCEDGAWLVGEQDGNKEHEAEVADYVRDPEEDWFWHFLVGLLLFDWLILWLISD